MARFVQQSPGLREPQVAVKIPGPPTLPDLKKIARDQRDAGVDILDQSAGDIDDVGKPLGDAFLAFIEDARDTLCREGHEGFARKSGEAYGFPACYRQQFPIVNATLARSWGLSEPGTYDTLQTISGRTAIDLALRGMVARADDAGKGPRRALILDPLAWSGYEPLASAFGLELIHLPALPHSGLRATAEGLAAALEMARTRKLTPIGAIPILPSNPTGVGTSHEELRRYVETAAESDLPVMIDAFYSPLAPEGHAEAVPMAELQAQLAPEAAAYLGMLVGETKVTSSQNKTATLIWLTPGAGSAIGSRILGVAGARMRAANAYPRPSEALVAYALHTFPAGVHAALGPRYLALDAARKAMREVCDDLGLPLSIGGSFYGTVALVDREGQPLVRDGAGRPLTDAKAVAEALIGRYGLVGAPGGMFSPAPEASSLLRLTAAVTLADVAKLRGILESMLAGASRG